MIHRIEIVPALRHGDPRGRSVQERTARFAGVRLESVRSAAVYAFDGERIGLEDGALAPEALRKLGEGLFAGPILPGARGGRPVPPAARGADRAAARGDRAPARGAHGAGAALAAAPAGAQRGRDGGDPRLFRPAR